MKLDYIPCLCVLNITSWAGYSIGATHFYGKLVLVKQCTDPDYGLITLDTIEDWSPSGEEIELKKVLTIKDAKLLDEKEGGHGWEGSVRRGRMLSNKFNSIEEVIKFGIKKYKQLKLNCDFISLYEGEKFKETVIIKK
jgi:hypothetical protein